MYGLVNQAVEELVCTRFGLVLWQQVKRRAGIETDTFLSMEPYPDEVTFRLMAALAAETGTSQAELLRGFGRHWVQFAGGEGYGALFHLAGDSFAAFLHNLDALHTRVGLSFPKLRPP